MNLETRKLNIIKYLIGLQDENVFNKIESTIIESQKSQVIKNNPRPFTQGQLLSRARQSDKDYKAGKFKTQEQLENESESW